MTAKDPNAIGPVSPEQLAELVDRHAAVLELYARQLCSSPEDAVQEAFVELAARGEPPDEPVAWLYRVVRNKAFTAARSARRRRRHETEAAAGKTDWFARSPEDAVDARAAAEALEALSAEDCEVVVAHLWGGLTFEQVGRLIGVSDSTAHRRYVAALSELREKLGVSCQKKK